ncbi:TPA: hypothetical protein ACW7J6_004485, partial [Escherichia coli]
TFRQSEAPAGFLKPLDLITENLLFAVCLRCLRDDGIGFRRVFRNRRCDFLLSGQDAGQCRVCGTELGNNLG